MSATAFPRRRVEVGMVKAEPEAAVRTNPPAVVKAAVERGSRRNVGDGAGAAVENESRQAAIAKTIKP